LCFYPLFLLQGPLQQDKAQQQLVAAARNKAKAKSPRGESPKASSPPSSPRQGVAPANGASPGVPPPLPKKKVLAKEDLLEFVFCVECGARNKTFRTQCVACNAELEIPEGVAIPPKPKKGHPDKCVVSGAGLESGVQKSSGKAAFEVLLRDENNAPVGKLAAGKLEILIEGPAGEIEANVNTAAGDDSKVLVEYDQSLAGAYQIMVSLDGKELGDAPYVVDVVLVVDAAKCSAAGSALDNGVMAGQTAEFTVVTRDVCGNPCVVGGSIVEVEVEAASSGAASPRQQRAEKPETNVLDRENGAYDVTIKYPAAGKYTVHVRIGGAPVAGSPFAVTVDKPPTAGSKWQAKFEEENEARRKKREQERLDEIERAKEKYMQHAEEAVNHARAKEAAELAEKQRLREIEEHMERMRTEEG
jgi:ribosomal protein L40E